MMRPITLFLALLLVTGAAHASIPPSPYAPPPDTLDDAPAAVDSARRTHFNLAVHAGMMRVSGDQWKMGFSYGGDLEMEQSPHIFASASLRYGKLHPTLIGREADRSGVDYSMNTLDIFSLALGVTYRTSAVPEPAFYLGLGLGATSYQKPNIPPVTEGPLPIERITGVVDKTRISSITLHARAGLELPILGRQRAFVEMGIAKNLQEVGLEWMMPITAGVRLNF